MKNPYAVARGLGWFSVALGLSELVLGRPLARWLGSRKSTDQLRLYGARELLNGVALLSQEKPAASWVWARVLGDAMDLWTLGRLYRQPGGEPENVAMALAAVAGATVADLACATALSREESAAQNRPEVMKSITIGRSMEELFDFYRQPANLALIQAHFAVVTETGPQRTHWRVKGPWGESLSWEAEHFEERPHLLRWHTLPGASVPNEGSVHFAPAPDGRGTEVTLRMAFEFPGGSVGRAAAQLVKGGPAIITLRALRRFKALVETGELPTLEKNSTARGGALANAY